MLWLWWWCWRWCDMLMMMLLILTFAMTIFLYHHQHHYCKYIFFIIFKFYNIFWSLHYYYSMETQLSSRLVRRVISILYVLCLSTNRMWELRMRLGIKMMMMMMSGIKVLIFWWRWLWLLLMMRLRWCNYDVDDRSW